MNGDGIVDVFDINLISSNWGATGGGGATAVPEPSTIVLAISAGILLGLWHLSRYRSQWSR